MYIFFVSLVLLSACKTDAEIPEESHIDTHYYDQPHDITFESSRFPLLNHEDTNIAVIFARKDQVHYLYLDGGEYISFAATNDCALPLQKGDVVNEKLLFQRKLPISTHTNELSCQLVDTSYIGVRVTFEEYPYREQFGWLMITNPLANFWSAREFTWQTINHQDIIVGAYE